MDSVLNYTNQLPEVEFIVSLDYNLEEFSDYECYEWGELYEVLGFYGNNPLIISGDTDFNLDGQFDHHLWNMLAGTTYSSYAIIDHHMVVRHLYDTPNYNDFVNVDLPILISNMHGCTDQDALNYNPSSVYSDNSCMYGDVNGDGVTNINDVINLVSMVLGMNADSSNDYNGDSNVDIFDILTLVNSIVSIGY